MPENYLKEAGAAEYLGRSISWMYKRRRADRQLAAAGKSILGPRWYVDPVNGYIHYGIADLDRWLNHRPMVPPPELFPSMNAA
jgi:hypothetical protein